MLKRTHRIGAVALSAAMMFMAACSESVDDTASSNTTAKNDSTESTAPQTRTTRGITDTSIKVGGVQYGVYFGDASVGVEARIKEANDAGGVHGRTLEFIGAQENNNDATKDLDLVRALVEQDEVFALLPVMAGTFGATDYIVDNNIPTFGYGITPAFCNNEIAFGVTGCVTNPDLTVGSNALGTVLADYFDGDTNKTIAFIGEDNDAGRGGLALLGASVEDKGFEIVYSEPAMPAPPEQVGDVSPFVSALLAEDPDVIYLQATLSGTKIADALQQADYDGVIISPSFSPLLLGQPGYEGILINTQVGVDPEIEGLAHLLESVHAIKPDQQLSLALITGYLAADMFIKGLEETGEDLTVENFLATMNDGFTYSVDGVVGESTWPDNHSKPVPCSVLTKTENAQFVPFQALQCGTNIDVK
ncbi:MAG: ABC transporter substrate-binding protein [Microthrixaceae bacterium]|nr:ABC transporter substrate-binding protein [Microthrixaceae bacterium]MCO5311462.1 ABC transporter substrate-binding protein [Microthrixaceae bacterium]